jgi:hypothetical protein
MSHTLLADDYKIVRSALLENPNWEAVIDAGDGQATIAPEASDQVAALKAAAAASLPMPCRTPASVGSRLGLLCSALAQWFKACADNYAAAATYEDLSRLSDTQLKHRGLSRDILARDLSVR